MGSAQSYSYCYGSLSVVDDTKIIMCVVAIAGSHKWLKHACRLIAHIENKKLARGGGISLS